MNALLVTCMMIIKLSHGTLMLPKTSGYVKRYDPQTKWMWLLIPDFGVSTAILTLFFPIFPFDPPENISKQEVF